MRSTSKQIERGHAIGCALVKHRVLLTVDKVSLFNAICVLSYAMQEIAQKLRFSAMPFSMDNSKGPLPVIVYKYSLSVSGTPVSPALALFTINHLPINVPRSKALPPDRSLAKLRHVLAG